MMPSPARPDQRFALGGGPWPAAEGRVTRLVRLSNRGDYEEAAQAAEALLAEGVHDVQVVVRAFFGTFLARGFVALPAVLGSLAHTLEAAAASLGPPGGRPWMEVDVALVWLGRTIKDRIDFHQAQRDDIFKGWVAAADLALVEAIRAAVARLADEVERALPGS
ncbi:MAG TPA: hypothetical protein VFS00_12885, partial [Polyangiaceae bacterium]|nr:hypothetical protein [Polyangiaceae bacterium]